MRRIDRYFAGLVVEPGPEARRSGGTRSHGEIKMFSTKWRTSPRQYEVTIERDLAIPVRDGVTLDSDIFRPDADGKFPALLAVHAYSKAVQSAQMLPEGFSYARGFIETGDFNFYVRRGYALAIVNITGTHASGGIFNNIDPQSIQDVCEAVEW